MTVLRNFGHIIENFRARFSRINAELCAKIENYLAIYCSDSLKRLAMTCNSSRIVFKDLSEPFKKVTDLRIFLVLEQTYDHIQFLNEGNLPNLNKVEIHSHKSNNLEELEQKIHFENIEYFKFWAYENDKYPFSFGNLKHLTIGGGCQVNDVLCECIGSVGDLRTLGILTRKYALNSGSFRKILELPNVLSNLEEIQFKYIEDMSLDDVLRFLKSSKNLRKMTFHKYLYCEQTDIVYNNFLEMLSSNMGVEWKLYLVPRSNGFFIYTVHVIERIIDG